MMKQRRLYEFLNVEFRFFFLASAIVVGIPVVVASADAFVPLPGRQIELHPVRIVHVKQCEQGISFVRFRANAVVEVVGVVVVGR